MSLRECIEILKPIAVRSHQKDCRIVQSATCIILDCNQISVLYGEGVVKIRTDINILPSYACKNRGCLPSMMVFSHASRISSELMQCVLKGCCTLRGGWSLSVV